MKSCTTRLALGGYCGGAARARSEARAMPPRPPLECQRKSRRFMGARPTLATETQRHRGCTEKTKRSNDHALNTGFQYWDIKVEDQARANATKAEIGQ